MNAGPNTALVVIDAQQAFVDRGLRRPLFRHRRRAAKRRSTRPALSVHRRAPLDRADYLRAFGVSSRAVHQRRSESRNGARLCAEEKHRLRVGIGSRALTARRGRSHEAPRRRRGVGCVSRRDQQAIGNGINRIVVVGFQFTTYVAASAVSTLKMVRGRWRWRDGRRSVRRIAPVVPCPDRQVYLVSNQHDGVSRPPGVEVIR